jgi:hypothetical protein
VTRDELVQAAAYALYEAGANFEPSNGVPTVEDAVEVVVDTVLAKLGAVPVIPRHADGRPVQVTSTEVDIHDVSYTATTFYDE